jgi:proline-specific peptidase
VFYDQLGCGASDYPGAGLWTGRSSRFSRSWTRCARPPASTEYHLLGHGWGGILALEHTLREPGGVASLVLSSAIASVPQWRRELVPLIKALPDEIRLPLYRHSAEGTAGSAECCCVVDAVLRRNLCRLTRGRTASSAVTSEARSHPEARNAMLGPNELEPAGLLADWDVTPQGWARSVARHWWSRGGTTWSRRRWPHCSTRASPRSEWVVFEHSAHVPHLEEPQRYLEVLDGFLEKAEGAQR